MINLPIKLLILKLLDLKSRICYIFTFKTNRVIMNNLIIKEKINVNNQIIKQRRYDNLENIEIHELL